MEPPTYTVRNMAADTTTTYCNANSFAGNSYGPMTLLSSDQEVLHAVSGGLGLEAPAIQPFEWNIINNARVMNPAYGFYYNHDVLCSYPVYVLPPGYLYNNLIAQNIQLAQDVSLPSRDAIALISHPRVTTAPSTPLLLPETQFDGLPVQQPVNQSLHTSDTLSRGYVKSFGNGFIELPPPKIKITTEGLQTEDDENETLQHYADNENSNNSAIDLNLDHVESDEPNELKISGVYSIAHLLDGNEHIQNDPQSILNNEGMQINAQIESGALQEYFRPSNAVQSILGPELVPPADLTPGNLFSIFQEKTKSTKKSRKRKQKSDTDREACGNAGKRYKSVANCLSDTPLKVVDPPLALTVSNPDVQPVQAPAGSSRLRIELPKPLFIKRRTKIPSTTPGLFKSVPSDAISSHSFETTMSSNTNATTNAMQTISVPSLSNLSQKKAPILPKPTKRQNVRAKTIIPLVESTIQPILKETSLCDSQSETFATKSHTKRTSTSTDHTNPKVSQEPYVASAAQKNFSALLNRELEQSFPGLWLAQNAPSQTVLDLSKKTEEPVNLPNTELKEPSNNKNLNQTESNTMLAKESNDCNEKDSDEKTTSSNRPITLLEAVQVELNAIGLSLKSCKRTTKQQPSINKQTMQKIWHQKKTAALYFKNRYQYKTLARFITDKKSLANMASCFVLLRRLPPRTTWKISEFEFYESMCS